MLLVTASQHAVPTLIGEPGHTKPRAAKVDLDRRVLWVVGCALQYTDRRAAKTSKNRVSAVSTIVSSVSVLVAGMVSSISAVIRGGGGGAGAPGTSMSPANVLKAILETSSAANTMFLTGFIDLLLKV